MAFSEPVCAALLALDVGDEVALAGMLKLGAWIDHDGNAKPNLDLPVARLLMVYHLKRRRQAVGAVTTLSAARNPPGPKNAALARGSVDASGSEPGAAGHVAGDEQRTP
jgi:hypothetical protein